MMTPSQPSKAVFYAFYGYHQKDESPSVQTGLVSVTSEDKYGFYCANNKLFLKGEEGRCLPCETDRYFYWIPVDTTAPDTLSLTPNSRQRIELVYDIFLIECGLQFSKKLARMQDALDTLKPLQDDKKKELDRVFSNS